MTFCCNNAINAYEKEISDQQATTLSTFFKIFSEPTRLKILFALKECELCVKDIATITQTEQTAISHQLKILKQNNLIKSQKKGKMVIYSLDDNHIFTILNDSLMHINHSKI